MRTTYYGYGCDLSAVVLLTLVRKKNKRTLEEDEYMRHSLACLADVDNVRAPSGGVETLSEAQTEFVRHVLPLMISRDCPRLGEVMAVYDLSPEHTFPDPSEEIEVGFVCGDGR
jgi:hypothetical protein